MPPRPRPTAPCANGLLRMLVACSCLWAATAVADGGELTTALLIDQELAFLRPPAGVAPSGSPIRLYVPRFGGRLDYGLTNRWRLGLAARASLTRPTHFAIDHLGSTYKGGALRAATRDVQLTATFAWTLLDGEVLFIDLLLEGGAVLRRWQLTARDGGDGPKAVVADLAGASWQANPYARLGFELRWRPWSHVAFGLGPYVASSFPVAMAYGAGLTCGIPLGAGPNL